MNALALDLGQRPELDRLGFWPVHDPVVDDDRAPQRVELAIGEVHEPTLAGLQSLINGYTRPSDTGAHCDHAGDFDCDCDAI